jgi:hypothetical protein
MHFVSQTPIAAGIHGGGRHSRMGRQNPLNVLRKKTSFP